ncbi:colicin immunity domain-containing protein [Rhodococcoides yunnanense]|uniref:colicin immunity domain-containing protein n=1 Tax=Rhodococcoides yunnanense TaxID=278209 RepID=UPI0009325430
MRDFVDHRISASDFDTRYLRLVENYPGLLDPRVFRSVDLLFYEVDALVLDERLRDRNDRNEIDEYRLPISARDTLAKLQEVRRQATRFRPISSCWARRA